MALDARGGSALSGGCIAQAWSLRPGRNLTRIIRGHVSELGVAHALQERSHEPVLALSIDVGLHRPDEILRILSDEAWHPGLPADPARAVTRRTGDGLGTRSMLVGSHRVGEVSRVLAGKARPRGNDGDPMLAMASRAHADGTPSGGWIADKRGFRPSGDLPRVIRCNAVELCVAHTREHRAHELVVALAVDVSLHRRDEILRVLPDEAGRARPPGHSALAVTGRAADRLDVLGAGAVAAFAVELTWLGLADPAHKRVAKRCGLQRMTPQTGFRADQMADNNRCSVSRRCLPWLFWRRSRSCS